MGIWEGLQQLPFDAKASIIIPTIVAVLLWAITDIRGRAKNAEAGTNIHGSVIFSDRQMGGQVAHSIVNLGPQPRLLGDEAVADFIATLRQYPPIEAEVFAVVGDPENFELATQLKNILTDAEWTVDQNHGWVVPLSRGIMINTPRESPALQAFGDYLAQAGLVVSGKIDEELSKPKIIVGPSS